MTRALLGGGIYVVDDNKEWETLRGTVWSYMRRGSRRQHSAMRRQGSTADRVDSKFVPSQKRTAVMWLTPAVRLTSHSTGCSLCL